VQTQVGSGFDTTRTTILQRKTEPGFFAEATSFYSTFRPPTVILRKLLSKMQQCLIKVGD
jgi:hypothetical protein